MLEIRRLAAASVLFRMLPKKDYSEVVSGSPTILEVIRKHITGTAAPHGF